MEWRLYRLGAVDFTHEEWILRLAMGMKGVSLCARCLSNDIRRRWSGWYYVPPGKIFGSRFRPFVLVVLADDGDSLIRAPPLKSNDVLKKCWAWLIIICISILDFDMKFPRWGYYRVEGLEWIFSLQLKRTHWWRRDYPRGSQISVFGGAVRVIRVVKEVKEDREDREVRGDFGLWWFPAGNDSWWRLQSGDYPLAGKLYGLGVMV